MTRHHARSVLPFTMTYVPMRPLFHMAAVIGANVLTWDSQPEFGDTNRLVDTLDAVSQGRPDPSAHLLYRHSPSGMPFDAKIT